jgi:hypothetical protein
MSNLELYHQEYGQLTQLQREMLSHCFLGALSGFVSESDWEIALNTAMRCAKVLRPEPETSELQLKGER